MRVTHITAMQYIFFLKHVKLISFILLNNNQVANQTTKTCENLQSNIQPLKQPVVYTVPQSPSAHTAHSVR